MPHYEVTSGQVSHFPSGKVSAKAHYTSTEGGGRASRLVWSVNWHFLFRLQRWPCIWFRKHSEVNAALKKCLLPGELLLRAISFWHYLVRSSFIELCVKFLFDRELSSFQNLLSCQQKKVIFTSCWPYWSFLDTHGWVISPISCFSATSKW